MSKKKYTAVSIFHRFRLCFRSLLLLVGIYLYTFAKIQSLGDGVEHIPLAKLFLGFIWIVYSVEMLMRFFPNRLESPGCQKQFAKNYQKTGKTEIQFNDNNATVLVALLWVTLNGILGALKLMGILDDGIMMLLCMFYSVCDMICILFFCPFQSWFLKNKCCSACRIYNWDYAMMFTPLFFVKSWYTWSLLALAVILLFRWEITIFLHPERFSENTNGYLKCSNCTEKLCAHKTQLQSLWQKFSNFRKEQIERLKK